MSNYAKRMAFLSARIFGEVARPTAQQNHKIVRAFAEKPIESRREIAEYYPKHPEITGLMHTLRHLGLYRDEHQDFKEEMKRLKTLRGKVKPKKGEGKRAQKRK